MSDEIDAGGDAGTTTTTTTTTDTGAAAKGGSLISSAGREGGGAGGAAPAAGAAAEGEGEGGDWRTKIAGEDRAYLKTLERYTDEGAYYKATRELHGKISSGALKPPPAPFPDKGTPEEQQAWRETQGVPVDAKGYKIELGEGLVLGENDKPGAERLAAFAHKNNWTNAQLNQVMTAYYAELEHTNAQRQEADGKFEGETKAALKDLWKGAAYDENMTAIRHLLDAAPKGIEEKVFGGRGPDGRIIGSDPEVVRWLAGIAREALPSSPLLPEGANNAGGVATELEKIRALKVSDPDAYDRDKTLQARELELIAFRDKQKSRAA